MKESSDGYLKLCVCTNWIWMIFYFIGIVSHYHCNSKPFDSQKQQAQQSARKIMIFFALVSIWGFPNDRYSSLDGANITLFPSEEASNHHPRVQRCIGLMSCALSLTQQKLPRIRFGVPTDVPHFCKKNWESGDGSEWLFLVIFAFHGGQFWYLHTHTNSTLLFRWQTGSIKEKSLALMSASNMLVMWVMNRKCHCQKIQYFDKPLAMVDSMLILNYWSVA